MIPTAALRQRCTLRPFLGVDGFGVPAYGEPVTNVPCRLVKRSQVMRTSTGTEVNATAVLEVRPTTVIGEQAQVELGLSSYVVLAIDEGRDLTRPWSIVAGLGEPSS